MLRITDLTFRYTRKSPVVLDNISLSLKDGEIGVLLGKTVRERQRFLRLFWDLKNRKPVKWILTEKIC